jgi:acetolactate synthase-1/2/3 large subunit
VAIEFERSFMATVFTAATNMSVLHWAGAGEELMSQPGEGVEQSPAAPVLGGHLVAQELRRQGVEVVFCVPGESYLDILDGLMAEPSPRLISCRHEAAAANMAVAVGKATGRPGVCLVSRGPGAMHASIAVHIAYQDSAPLLLLVGQVPREDLNREAFQEMDYARVFSSTAKWVVEVIDPERLTETLSAAFHVAVSGRPGPVVVVLPEDVLAARVAPAPTAPVAGVSSGVDLAAVERVAGLLTIARRPLLIAGATGWSQAVADQLRQLAERLRLPVMASFRAQDVLDNRSPVYAGALGVGSPASAQEGVRAADLLIAVGTRLDEMTAGAYRLLSPADRGRPLVMVHPGAEELGRVFDPTVKVAATPAAFLAALGDRTPGDSADRGSWAEGLREGYERSRQGTVAGEVDLARIVRHASEALPEDTPITNGAGSYTAFVHRYHQFKRFGTQLAPVAGAMGFGVPAAIAAMALKPGRKAVCYAGDGCFLMSGQELATAVQYGLPIIVIVVNNSSYGSIRVHQDRRFPGRAVGTDLVNPDFVAYARSFGAEGELVTTTDQFAAGLDRALRSAVPYLIEVRVSGVHSLPS